MSGSYRDDPCTNYGWIDLDCQSRAQGIYPTFLEWYLRLCSRQVLCNYDCILVSEKDMRKTKTKCIHSTTVYWHVLYLTSDMVSLTVFYDR